jgi:uncharacterized alkaline shock family protein YloU
VDGTIRISATTVAEVVAFAAQDVEGVTWGFDRILGGVELFRGKEPVSREEKILLEEKELTVCIHIGVHHRTLFFKVAQAVQKNVYDALLHRLGVQPHRVHVEVQEVDWSNIDERG